jgi:uncharacterized protein YciI
VRGDRGWVVGRPRRFQQLSIVRLRAPETPVPDDPDDDRIQQEHLAYLHGLQDQGLILVNGPVRRADDPRFRGMSIYAVPVDEARRLALDDPAVRAGWFEPHVDGWLIPAEPVALGTRVEVEFPDE